MLQVFTRWLQVRILINVLLFVRNRQKQTKAFQSRSCDTFVCTEIYRRSQLSRSKLVLSTFEGAQIPFCESDFFSIQKMQFLNDWFNVVVIPDLVLKHVVAQVKRNKHLNIFVFTRAHPKCTMLSESKTHFLYSPNLLNGPHTKQCSAKNIDVHHSQFRFF